MSYKGNGGYTLGSIIPIGEANGIAQRIPTGEPTMAKWVT